MKLKSRHQSIGTGLSLSANCNDDSYFRWKNITTTATTGKESNETRHLRILYNNDSPLKWHVIESEYIARFYIEGQPIRLRLLSKDRQSLLKLISFDFLVVCMQVLSKEKDTSQVYLARITMLILYISFWLIGNYRWPKGGRGCIVQNAFKWCKSWALGAAKTDLYIIIQNLWEFQYGLQCNSGAMKLIFITLVNLNFWDFAKFVFASTFFNSWSQVQKQREDRENSHFSACLDENIWEYEFKRLNKHKKKWENHPDHPPTKLFPCLFRFLAPIILLGYFRDILRLGQVVIIQI